MFETWRVYRITQEERKKILEKATRKAIMETHAAGRPSCHGDNLGVYNLYPDGTKNILNYTKKGDFEWLLKSQELQP